MDDRTREAEIFARGWQEGFRRAMEILHDPAGPAPDCAHTLTGPPAEAVVNAFLHGRDCLGEAPSQRALSRTYGVSRPKVAALVGPLNGHLTEPAQPDNHGGGAGD